MHVIECGEAARLIADAAMSTVSPPCAGERAQIPRVDVFKATELEGGNPDFEVLAHGHAAG